MFIGTAEVLLYPFLQKGMESKPKKYDRKPNVWQEVRFTHSVRLTSYINVDVLRAIHQQMDKHKAYGIDKVTKEEYGQNLEENLENLVERMKKGSYKPKPIRRAYIPKDGSSKMRPLGISCYEDKLVEHAMVQILTQIYEPKFYNESFGFRPNRSCHQAVREVIEDVQYRKTNYVVEVDIRSFFDTVDHGWMAGTGHPAKSS